MTPTMSNACYTCTHRSNTPGDCHSACGAVDFADGIMSLAVRRAGVINGQPVILFPVLKSPIQAVAVDHHGWGQGWACWPLNFDPVWLVACTMHKPRQLED